MDADLRARPGGGAGQDVAHLAHRRQLTSSAQQPNQDSKDGRSRRAEEGAVSIKQDSVLADVQLARKVSGFRSVGPAA